MVIGQLNDDISEKRGSESQTGETLPVYINPTITGERNNRTIETPSQGHQDDKSTLNDLISNPDPS